MVEGKAQLANGGVAIVDGRLVESAEVYKPSSRVRARVHNSSIHSSLPVLWYA
jgi:hypothetical protein